MQYRISFTAVGVIAFCALSWLAVGDASYRALHDGRGPGLTRTAAAVIHKPIKLIERSLG